MPQPLAYAACDLEARVGAFNVQLAEEFTSVFGSVRSGVVPGDVPEVSNEQAGCRLYTRRDLFCNPSCGSSMTCGADMTCIAFPVKQDLGAVTVDGLAAALSMLPNTVNDYTNPAMPALPHPGFSEGAEIVLRAAGGAYAPFELRGRGVSAMTISGDPIVVRPGEPLNIAWQPPVNPSSAQRVLLKLELNNHGSTPARLECTVEDTGSFAVPAEILSELIAIEVSGWPTLTIRRTTADSASIEPGCVEFNVMSEQALSIEVAGYASCNLDNPCPGGQTCDASTQLCM
jgi:hypothetical protein